MTTTYRMSAVAAAVDAVCAAQQLGPTGHGMGLARARSENDFVQWRLDRGGRAPTIEIGVAEHAEPSQVRAALGRLGVVPHPTLDVLVTLPDVALARAELVRCVADIFAAYGAQPDEELRIFPAEQERDPVVVQPVVEAAESCGLLVWRGFPAAAPDVMWPDSGDVAGFLDVAVRLQARVLYIGVVDQELLAGFAIDGVVHTVVLLSHDADEDEDYGDDDEDRYPAITARFDPQAWHRNILEQSYQALPEHVRSVVDAVVRDPRYDNHARAEAAAVLAEHASALTSEEFGRVEREARTRFQELVGDELDREADTLAGRLVGHPEFDPLDWSGETAESILLDDLEVDDPRIVRRAARAAQQLAHERGLGKKAQANLDREAAQLLQRLPVLVRDQAGFTSRNAQREALLEPHLGDVSPRRRSRIISAMRDADERENAAMREARYATAVRRLLAAGETKAATSRTLGISSSTLDRLLRNRHPDVELGSDDPILTELAPQLGDAR